MSLQMSFPNPYDSTSIIAASYWVPAQINLDTISQTGRIIWLGYVSQTAFASGEPSIASHSYQLTPTQYASYFSPSKVDPQGVDHVSQSHRMALNTFDVESGTDATGNPIMVSFFKNATQVS
jgi:hypothetical protein